MDEIKCRITFFDGEEMNLVWPKRSDQDNLTSAKIREKFLSDQMFAVEVDGKLLIVPVTSIRTIEIDPAPEPLPAIVARSARLAD